MNEKMRAQLELFMELENYVRNGIPIYLSGKPASPDKVVEQVMVKEDNVYMADYVRNEEGTLQQICYDRIDSM